MLKANQKRPTQSSQVIGRLAMRTIGSSVSGWWPYSAG
jgi:hypothetical protein